MPDPRMTAVRTVLAVLDGRSLDRQLVAADALEDPRDRALAADLSYGVCRWYRRLDALVSRLLKTPFKPRDRDLQVVLMVGAYQLLHSRVPPHAAVSTAVDTVRRLGKPWAAGLVNGVLRRLQREQTALIEIVDCEPAVRFALPDWLYQAISAAWSDAAQAICATAQQRPPMTLRVDLSRISRNDYAMRLGADGVVARPHREVASALVLDAAVGVDRLPGFEDGLVSVQDAGAQLAAPFLDLRPGLTVLDACAAPGGKTLHLLQSVDRLGLTALDIDAARLERVAQNLARGGYAAELVAADAAAGGGDWARQTYDRILLDAPCSATGVLRRHPDIRLLRRPGDIAELGARQDALLNALWPLLKPGGRLLYVTCSLLPAENAERVDAFIDRTPDVQPVQLPITPGRRSGKGVQLLPGIDDTDGFFYAALHKRDAAAS